jgi:alkaline phosphatase
LQPFVNSAVFVFAVVLLIGISGCATPQPTAKQNQAIVPVAMGKPKNVILMIGDGMGLPQITGSMYMNSNRSVFERFTNIGFHKSHSSDNLVTDSAAGATAFASGVKTYNGAIGVNAKKESVPTLLEMAEKKGMATGMVMTCSVIHATPASFIAHVKGRENREEIALAYLDTPIDIFIGGGLDYFIRRVDGRNLVHELEQKNYRISDFIHEEVDLLPANTEKNIGYFTSNEEPLPADQGRDYFIPAINKALNFIDDRSDKGFFMMIEGSQIDWGGHSNEAKYVLNEMQEFEVAIDQVMDFIEKDGNTLLVITGDHETGGFAVQPGSKLNEIVVSFTTKSHTAVMIPVFAAGPGAEAFRGMYENTAIFDKIKAALDLQ